MKCLLFVPLISIYCFAQSSVALSMVQRAAPANVTPVALISNLCGQAIHIVDTLPNGTQRVAAFHQIFEDYFDVKGIGDFVLGRYRRVATPQQEQEFLALYGEFTAQIYSSRLAAYRGAAFRIVGSRLDGNEEVVDTEISAAGTEPGRLEWRLVNENGGFKVTDISLDGVSMKVTERQQFAGIIQRNDGTVFSLLASMRDMIAQGQE